MLSNRRLLTALMLFLLSGSVHAQTWFTVSVKQHETVAMLKDIFRRPVSEWQLRLSSNSAILDDRFFENIEKRIRWGLKEGHIDDAFRFALLGDKAGVIMHRRTDFQRQVREQSGFGDRIQRYQLFDHSNSGKVTVGLGGFRRLIVDLETMKKLALWELWPSSRRAQRKQKDMLSVLFRKPLYQWDEELKKHQELFTEDFFRIATEIVETKLLSDDHDQAICFALVGDKAARIVGKNLRLGFQVTVFRGEAPWVYDPYEDRIHVFPRPAVRSTEGIVPWVKESEVDF